MGVKFISMLMSLLVTGLVAGLYIGTRDWGLATVILVGLGVGAVITLVALVIVMNLRRPPGTDAPAIR